MSFLPSWAILEVRATEMLLALAPLLPGPCPQTHPVLWPRHHRTLLPQETTCPPGGKTEPEDLQGTFQRQIPGFPGPALKSLWLETSLALYPEML